MHINKSNNNDADNNNINDKTIRILFRIVWGDRWWCQLIAQRWRNIEQRAIITITIKNPCTQKFNCRFYSRAPRTNPDINFITCFHLNFYWIGNETELSSVNINLKCSGLILLRFSSKVTRCDLYTKFYRPSILYSIFLWGLYNIVKQ